MSEAVLRISRNPVNFDAFGTTGTCVLVPSSLDRNDPLARELANLGSMPDHQSIIHTPHWRGPFRRIAMPELNEWVRLDQTLATAPHLIVVINLGLIGNRGPFALDLAARFLAPVDRAKLLASPLKVMKIARINLARRGEVFLIGVSTSAGTVWIETQDVVAAELAALALTESRAPANRRHLSPWEDELVQRATEIGLGARYPGDIRIEADRAPDDRDMNEIVTALHLRIGIDISSISAHY